jgi:hypothetical protein
VGVGAERANGDEGRSSARGRPFGERHRNIAIDLLEGLRGARLLLRGADAAKDGRSADGGKGRELGKVDDALLDLGELGKLRGAQCRMTTFS